MHFHVKGTVNCACGVFVLSYSEELLSTADLNHLKPLESFHQYSLYSFLNEREHTEKANTWLMNVIRNK